MQTQFPWALHCLHAGLLHAPEQHPPLTQKPLLQSAPELHPFPFAQRLPHTAPQSTSPSPQLNALSLQAQVPFTPHTQAPNGSVHAETFAHVPLATPVCAWLHEWQLPEHAVAQQTPCAQLPLRHWFAPPHAAPFAFLGTQAGAAQ